MSEKNTVPKVKVNIKPVSKPFQTGLRNSMTAIIHNKKGRTKAAFFQ
jgi:hypothetical protein